MISGAVKSEFVAKLRPGFYASIARSEHEFRYSRFTGHLLGYARVSTSDQDVALQVDALNAASCYRVFVDIISGSLDSRPELDKLLDQIQPGDTLVVWRLDRLGRSIRHLIDQLATLAEREVGFRSLQETIDTNSPGGRLVFHVFAAPAVFVPFLRANRFPIKAPGGTQTIPHLVRENAVPNGTRYKVNRSDETRLFYVAVTRAQKYLYVSYAPGESKLYKKPSDFYLHCTASTWMSTTDEGLPALARLTPTPKLETPNIAISFSELKYLIECPYQFKLRFMYGFNPPIHEALGYGKGLHDVLSEMHKRALAGDVPTKTEIESLVDRHLHTPYAYPALREQLRGSAIKAIDRYFDRHGDDLTRTIHSEKVIEVEISPGVTVNGRIDLIKSLETGETAIVDFKSTQASQAESVTKDQLSIYALGYEQLTGNNADRIQILNLDDQGKSTNDPVNPALVAAIKAKVDAVADDIRANHFVCTHDHTTESAYDDLAWMTKGGHAHP